MVDGSFVFGVGFEALGIEYGVHPAGIGGEDHVLCPEHLYLFVHFGACLEGGDEGVARGDGAEEAKWVGFCGGGIGSGGGVGDVCVECIE